VRAGGFFLGEARCVRLPCGGARRASVPWIVAPVAGRAALLPRSLRRCRACRWASRPMFRARNSTRRCAAGSSATRGARRCARRCARSRRCAVRTARRRWRICDGSNARRGRIGEWARGAEWGGRARCCRHFVSARRRRNGSSHRSSLRTADAECAVVPSTPVASLSSSQEIGSNLWFRVNKFSEFPIAGREAGP